MISAVVARGARSPIWLALVALTAVLAVAAPGASANGSKPVHAALFGVFAFGPCPAGAPDGAACLHDKVSGRLKAAGTVTGDFEVVIDAAHTSRVGVAPIAKRGSFVARNGDHLDVSATGTFDFAASVATYTYAVTGGTGRFRHASGTGTWLVPAPAVFDPVTGKGTGDEFLDGTLQVHP